MLAPELEQLVSEHPLRERFRSQLMLVLYRSGRQGEALEVFRRTRVTLVRELGIEPSPPLQQLERRILAHDPELDAPDRSRRSTAGVRGTVLVVATDEAGLATALAAIEPLASQRELILAQLLADDAEVGRAALSVNARAAAVGRNARAAAFTSADPAADVLRLSTGYDVELVLVPAPDGLEAVPLPDDLVQLLEGSPADVGVAAGIPADWTGGDGVYVPSEGPSTTGLRSRSALGSPPPHRRSFGSSVPAPIPVAAGATRAGCSRTRPSPRNGSSVCPVSRC
jgi:hypothetical protein